MKKVLIIILSALLVTGCVQVNGTIEIKKDKSMDLVMIEAINSSLAGDQDIMKAEDKSELEKNGYKVEKYTNGNNKGYKISKHYDNIDDISSVDEKEVDLSSTEDQMHFTVKKGFLKNTYKAKIKFDIKNDLDEAIKNGDTSLDDSNYDEGEDLTLDDTDLSGDDLALDDESGMNDTTGDDEDFDFDPSLITGNMDLSFEVKLPYKVINTNATTKDDDGKTLKWNLTSSDVDSISFEFFLYNMTNICILAGGVALIIIAVIVIVVVSGRKKDQINFDLDDDNKDETF